MSISPRNIPPRTLAQPVQARLVCREALLDELHREALARAESRATGEPLGAEVGAVSPRLHIAIGEALPVGLTTIDGGPGAGKTAFAMQVAMTCRVPALIVECEVRPVRLLERMTAYQTRTYLAKLKDGTLSPDTIRDLAQRSLADLPLVEMIDATALPISVAEIEREAVALRKRHSAKHVLVVIDSLHAWSLRSLTAVEKEYDRIGEAIRDLDGAAKSHHLSIITILERSLATMRDPSATSGKGHGGIGYAGEVALNLDAVGGLNETTGRRQIKLGIPKNRHGEQGFAIEMEFEGRLQRFTQRADATRRIDGDAEVEDPFAVSPARNRQRRRLRTAEDLLAHGGDDAA